MRPPGVQDLRTPLVATCLACSAPAIFPFGSRDVQATGYALPHLAGFVYQRLLGACLGKPGGWAWNC